MNPLMGDALAALAPVVAVLEELSVAYYVGGSVASSLYGRARSTMDVDLIADLAQRHVEPMVRALEGVYYVHAPTIFEAIRRRRCFHLIHYPTAFKVDVFVVKDREYDRTALRRALKDCLDPENPSELVHVATGEDMILAKLEWFRLGGEVSQRQWEDVQGMLSVQGEILDRRYLAQWAERIGIADLLEKAYAEADA